MYCSHKLQCAFSGCLAALERNNELMVIYFIMGNLSPAQGSISSFFTAFLKLDVLCSKLINEGADSHA